MEKFSSKYEMMSDVARTSNLSNMEKISSKCDMFSCEARKSNPSTMEKFSSKCDMISGVARKSNSLTAETIEKITSLIFAFVGISVSYSNACVESFPLICRALGGHRGAVQTHGKYQGEKSRLFDATHKTQNSLGLTYKTQNSLGFHIGDIVQIWSKSFNKWFEDGEITEIRSDGALFVQYNRQKPSGKWIPAKLAAQRILRLPSTPPIPKPLSMLGDVFSNIDKMADVQQVCEGSKAGIFSNCVVLVSPLGGSCMSSRRKQILQERIQEYGGAVAETWSQAVTHLVVAPEASEPTLQSEYGHISRGLEFVAVVNDLWLCHSLVRGRRLPEQDYLWHSARCVPEEIPKTPPPMNKRSSSSTGTPEAKRRKVDTTSMYPMKEGDWCCPKCGQHNFRKRDVCWRKGCGCLRTEVDSSNHATRQADQSSQLSLEQGSKDGSCKTPEALRSLIEEEFRTCGDGWAARGDKWRSWQYKKAELLMKQAQGLSSNELEQLGLTAKFVEKCKEIKRNGFLDQAARFRQDPDLRVLLELTRMHGVGEKLAHRWLRMGIRSLDDVRSQMETLPSSASGPATGLSKSQRLALQFVDDFREKIARGEVERFAESVRHQLKNLRIDGHVVPCGSYRAGEEWSSSVILVVSVDNGADIGETSEQILGALRQSTLLVADLSLGTLAEPWARTACRPAGTEPPHARVFLGVGQGMPVHGDRIRYRRLDLVFCGHEALPFATIQWTGNDGGIFNRELKRIAAFRGFHLSTTYLCKAEREGVRGRNVGNICRAGFRIDCATEEDVFAALGLPYRPPDQRRMDADMLAIVDRASLTVSAYRTEVKAAFDRAKNLSQA